MSIKTRNQQVDPELQSLLEDELQYGEKTSFKFNQIKIPKGHSWLLRYIPVAVDPKKGLPFLRIARHWVNKKPHNCPKHSSGSIGGSIDNTCPCCAAADAFANSPNETVKREARLLQGTPRFLTYCLVLAREDDRKHVEEVTGSELWTPYEHWIPKGAFADWLAMFRKGSAKSKHSICDWKRGNDIWVTADRQSRLTWDKEDTSAIIDTDNEAKFKKITGKIIEQIKFPSFVMTDEDTLEQLAEKITDMLEELENSSQGRRSRSSDDEEDAPRSSRRRSSDDEEDERPKRRRVDEDEDEDEPKKDDDFDEEEEDETPKKSKRAAEEPKRRNPKPIEDEDEEEEDESEEEEDGDEEEEDETPRKSKKPSKPDPEAEEEDEGEEDEKEEEEAPKKPKKPSHSPAGGDGDVDEDDDVADESEDPVPPKKTDVEDEDEEEEDESEEEEDGDEDEAPPKVSAKGTTGELDKAIKKRLANKR